MLKNYVMNYFKILIIWNNKLDSRQLTCTHSLYTLSKEAQAESLLSPLRNFSENQLLKQLS